MSLWKKHSTLFFGLGITLVFLWLGMSRLDFIDALELKFYDLRMALTALPEEKSDIVIVDIDDDSLEKLGRWPWPRSYLAGAIDKIQTGEPKLIGLNILFSEPEENSGLKVLAYLTDVFAKTGLGAAGPGRTFQEELSTLKAEMDNDKILANAVQKAGDIVLPAIILPRATLEDVSLEPEEALKRFALSQVTPVEGASWPKATEMLLPVPSLLQAAKGIGHISLSADIDGLYRRGRPVYEYRGLFIPAYELAIAALALNLPLDRIKVDLGASLSLGSIRVPLTTTSEFLVSFKGGRGSFKQFSFFDVVNDKIPLNVFKGKIVLIAFSASGFTNPMGTPVEPLMSSGEFSASVIWSMLHRHFIEQPAWNAMAELLAILFVGLIIAFVLPRLRALAAGLVFLVLAGGMIGVAVYLFVAKGVWITTACPLLELLCGYLGIISLKYLVTETAKEKVEVESAQSNKMLGLSFQEQGRLDQAFEKFRRVPVDPDMKETLYNLAIDFERKRQFHKAVAVYEHIEKHDPKFKDIRQRKSRMVQMGDTMVLGAGAMDPLLSTATDTRPTLGRYEIVKQLGKGAMGIVYLGKDPRINRTTAIKTFQFPDDLEADEADRLKQRFFKEAESAGTLTHPNIVTIYDAGEEKDLAYIAMEFLEGHDLQRYIKPEQLLPVSRVCSFMADIAEALDYAHQKGIVHRDIKPANVMLLDSGVVKITDFGIARITASSQTQTGVVKGTPHYMSPEQISGQKVDGRSDIFSLGVMTYQLLTGKTPFAGENLAALMHQIINVQQPDPRKFNPAIPVNLVRVLYKALEKDREKRFSKAADMAAGLRIVLAELGE